MSYPVAAARGRWSGGVSAFDPTQISGLQLWYAMRDPTTLFTDAARTTPVSSDGDVIGGIADKSGNGKHASQATTANKPLYKVSIKNGLSTLLSDATDYLDFTTKNLTGDFTLAAVMKRNDSSAARNDILVGASSANAYSLQFSGYNTPYAKLRLNYSDAGQSTQAFSSAAWFVICVTRQSTNIKFWKNGADVTSGTPSSSTTFSISRFLNGLIGYAGEIMVFDNFIGAANMTNIWTYLNGLWSVY